jgi:DNA repair photolyase
MSIIYRPKGAALEYAPLAANLYLGCSHACVYCYARRMALDNGWVASAEEFNARPRPKWADAEGMMGEFRKQLGRGYREPILLSFMTDPYQPLELETGLTRAALQAMTFHRQAAIILTKNPAHALARDGDLLTRCGHSLGATITGLDPDRAKKLEPGAPDPWRRLQALDLAAINRIKTWISLEPVIDPDSALAVIAAATTDHNPHIAIGLKSGSPYQIKHDWPAFLAKVRRVLGRYGYREVDYMLGWTKEPGTFLIKKSFKEAAK